jgi:hypothetical protein
VVCMTRQLDTLHEEPLRTEDFGEGELRSRCLGSVADCQTNSSMSAGEASRLNSTARPEKPLVISPLLWCITLTPPTTVYPLSLSEAMHPFSQSLRSTITPLHPKLGAKSESTLGKRARGSSQNYQRLPRTCQDLKGLLIGDQVGT